MTIAKIKSINRASILFALLGGTLSYCHLFKISHFRNDIISYMGFGMAIMGCSFSIMILIYIDIKYNS